MKKFFAIFATAMLMMGAIVSCGEKAEEGEEPATDDGTEQTEPEAEDNGEETDGAE